MCRTSPSRYPPVTTVPCRRRPGSTRAPDRRRCAACRADVVRRRRGRDAPANHVAEATSRTWTKSRRCPPSRARSAPRPAAAPRGRSRPRRRRVSRGIPVRTRCDSAERQRGRRRREPTTSQVLLRQLGRAYALRGSSGASSVTSDGARAHPHDGHGAANRRPPAPSQRAARRHRAVRDAAPQALAVHHHRAGQHQPSDTRPGHRRQQHRRAEVVVDA